MRHRRTSILLVAAVIATSLAAAQQENHAMPADPSADPKVVFEIVRDAHAALQRKDYEAARQGSLKALALDSRNQYALSYLGNACTMLGDLPQAEETYQTLIGIN